MVVGGSSSASDVVITVEPVREEKRTSSAEVREASRNNGSGLRGWAVEEVAWMVAQFAKVAVSFFAVRAVTKLFQIGAASQQAYIRAPRLWTHGPQEEGYQRGGGWRPTGSNGSYQASRGSSGSSGATGFDHGARQAAPESPRYVATVGGYHLYLHQTVLDPARQQWPCPILFKSACETCHFLEYDRGGTPHCAAVLKLRTVLDGVDGGEDFNEIRQWIRNS
jgi:hypothetical protein